ncbi:HEAT repeat domain-containing protein [Patescibacteria group bacterium]|nr:HEAT repeat domain-containing protein [Patescibacteria group bacterium]
MIKDLKEAVSYYHNCMVEGVDFYYHEVSKEVYMEALRSKEYSYFHVVAFRGMMVCAANEVSWGWSYMKATIKEVFKNHMVNIPDSAFGRMFNNWLKPSTKFYFEEYLTSEDWWVRKVVYIGLSRKFTQDLNQYTEALLKPLEGARFSDVVNTLNDERVGCIPGAHSLLVKVVKEGKGLVRLRAIKALQYYPARKSATDALRYATSDMYRHVRKAAVIELSRHKGWYATESLIMILNDPNEYFTIRKQAMLALSQRGGKRVNRALANLFKDDLVMEENVLQYCDR